MNTKANNDQLEKYFELVKEMKALKIAKSDPECNPETIEMYYDSCESVGRALRSLRQLYTDNQLADMGVSK